MRNINKFYFNFKKLFSSTSLLLVFALGFAGQGYAQMDYSNIVFPANNASILSMDDSDPVNTVVTIAYDLPCWASPLSVSESLEIEGSPLNPSADFRVILSVLLEGSPMLPCANTSREQIEITINTNAVEGSFLGIELVNEEMSTAVNLYGMVSGLTIDAVLKDYVLGYDAVTISYDVPCFSSVIEAEAINQVVVEPVSPSGGLRYSIALGRVLRSSPMLPCAGSTRVSETLYVNNQQSSGELVGYLPIQSL